MPEQCENCGTTIGNLEEPFLWNEHVVCSACYARLSASGSIVAAAPETIAPPDDIGWSQQRTIPTHSAGGVVGTAPMIGAVTCRFCGYIGAPLKIARGSIGTALLLLLCGIIPGIIYLIAFDGYDIQCARCHNVLKVEGSEW